VSSVPLLRPHPGRASQGLALNHNFRCAGRLADDPPILLDGHNRYAICATHNIPFEVVAVPVADHDEATRWIINNQLGRRNLTEAQKSHLRGQRYNLEKGRPGGDQKSNGENLRLNVADTLAKEYQQLGRRNLTEAHKSHLRGQRFNLEKNAIGTNQHSLPQNEGTTAERLDQRRIASRHSPLVALLMGQ
jgi:hypothetical protein